MKTIKNTLRITILLAFLVCAFSVCVSAGTYGDLTYTVSNGEVTITDCSTSVTSVIIPSEINGHPVTSIGEYAFYYCQSLASVEIPNSVTSIGDKAFFRCDSLESVTIGNGVTSIGEYAFYNCTSLESVTIGNGVTSIGNSAFSWCKSLTSIEIPDSVTSIGKSAFSDCTSLASVTIGNGVTSIGYGAFYSCKNLKTVYYTGSEEDWNCITFGSYNDLLHNAEIIFNYGAPDEYTVNSITIKDISGQALTEIPDGKFMATVSFTCNVSNSNVMVVLAKYTEDGKYDGLIYVSVEDAPVGSTLKITLPVDNSDGTLTKLKAFLWDSFELFKPVADSVCFPA